MRYFKSPPSKHNYHDGKKESRKDRRAFKKKGYTKPNNWIPIVVIIVFIAILIAGYYLS